MNGGEVVFNIRADGDEAKQEIKDVGSTAEDVGKKVGDAVKGIASALALAKAADFLKDITQQCVDSYAQFEQLTGGVEKLFADASDTVKQNAANAFATVGMSANEYMSTVTSFSSALITSLGGDTEAAAKKADMALTDMADNANVFGSTVESVQSAYQGFAKGQFQLLDNLKLGYGGSKTEMERLLADAEKLSGIKYDVDSYADIVDAIHVIQTEMKITGTTANEAAGTIEGSINSMKAAWQNLLTGLADPNQSVEQLTQNLTDSIENVRMNIMPRLTEIFSNMGDTAANLATAVLPMIPQSIEAILPSFVSGLGKLLDAVVVNGADMATAIADYLPEFINSVGDIMSGLMPAAVQAMSTVADALDDNAEDIVEQLIDTVTEFLSKDFPEIVPAAVGQALRIVTALVQGITDNADKMADAIPDIIAALLNALLDALPDVIASGEDVAQALSDAVIDFDWANFSRRLALALVDALERTAEYITSEGANNPLAQSIKSMIDPTGAVGAGMDVLGNVVGWDNIRDGINAAADAAEVTQENAQEAYDRLTERAERYNEATKNTAEEVAEITGDYMSQREAWAKMAEEEAKAHLAGWGDQGSGQSDPVKTLEEQLKEKEHLYAIHQLSEEDYLQKRLELLEQYRDEESEEWWADYDKTVDQINKLSQAKIDAQEKAAKDEADAQKKRDQEAAKAAADAEKKLKQEVTAKFRELKTEALKNGYDDQWLIDQENAFIETLDHESDLYADYHLKLLEQQESYNDKAEKAEKKAADERYKSISKLYEDVAKAQEKLSDSLDVGVSDIFKTETESDKRTGADRKKKSIAIDELEKQIEAKRQLPAKIADLLDSDVPDDLIRELLKLDPSDALEYANKLLSSPETMSRITKAFDEDRSLSDQLANMLTENSEDFDKLGYESGKIFGESFLDSLGEQWKERFGAIVTDEAVFNTLAAALPFMGTMNSVVTDSAQAAATGQRAQAITVEVIGKLTADGDNITAMVNSKNAKTQIISNR